MCWSLPLKFKSFFAAALVLGTATGALGAPRKSPAGKPQTPSPAQKAAEQDDNAMNAFIVQQLLASIKRSGCDFEFTGSINGKESSLDSLDVDCTLQLTDKEDLTIPLVQKEKDNPDQGFNTIVHIKSKGLYLRLLGQKAEGVSTLSARFYSGYDKAKKAWVPHPLEASVSVKNGDQEINSELVAIRLSGVDLKVRENPQNPKELQVAGSCKSEKKIFNFLTNNFEYRPAVCFLEGVYEPNQTSRFKFGFKNAGVKASLP